MTPFGYRSLKRATTSGSRRWMPSSWFPRVTLDGEFKEAKMTFWKNGFKPSSTLKRVTNWVGHCEVVRRAQSSWCRETAALSCRRSRLACGWWSGPEAGCTDAEKLKTSQIMCQEDINSTLLQPRWHHNPGLCWSPECFPSRPPEDKHRAFFFFFWRTLTKSETIKTLHEKTVYRAGTIETDSKVPNSAPSRDSSSDQSCLSGWSSEAGWFSPKWFHQRARSWERKQPNNNRLTLTQYCTSFIYRAL